MLHFAVKTNKNKDVIELLLDHGANLTYEMDQVHIFKFLIDIWLFCDFY